MLKEYQNFPGADVAISMEFFPTKTAEQEEAQWSVIEALSAYEPVCMTVTYGAGGSTKTGTMKLVQKIQSHLFVPAASHLTCVDSSRDEIDAIARDYWERGITRIVALRGDAVGGGKYSPRADGYDYADALVRGLLAIAPFDISVAAYPEAHPDASSLQFDLDHLKRKQDAGAARAITQYCFDTEQMLRFIDSARKAGVSMPIVPGILPIYNIKQAERFSARCGASFPEWLKKPFTGIEEQGNISQLVSTYLAAEQCRRLLQEGVEALHFYTLNRAEIVMAVCQLLGVRGK